MDTFKTIARLFEPKANNPRLMKYPYTLGAQIQLFPYKFYFQNQWIFRYYFIGVALTVPIFAAITKLVNSPENVAKWKEIRRLELLETHYADDDEHH